MKIETGATTLAAAKLLKEIERIKPTENLPARNLLQAKETT